MRTFVAWIHMQAHRSGKRRRILVALSAIVMGLMLLMAVADRVWAAIELAYYRGSATNSAVYLEWATVREVNLNGFEILCKRVGDPDTKYHAIGSRIARGIPSTYNFDVTSGLKAGESYCFRLREITSDETPGEAFDLCGYGPGLTPAPTTAATIVVSIPVTLTPTVIPVQPVPGIDVPTLAPTQDPALALTPATVFDATATPALPAVDQFGSPLVTPTPTMTLIPGVEQQQQPPGPEQPISPLPTALGQDPNVGVAQVPPTETPTPTVTPFATDTPFPTATFTETPTEIAMTEDQSGNPPVVIDPGANALPAVPDASAGLALAEATPTPLYVVVTATPTPQDALVMLPPTLTPWPTAIPTASFSLGSLLVPNTQNLMVGLLCLIFLSASGLGALGLVTSVLYMRSQTRRDHRLPGPTYDRRRY
ncbi:MAG: hypothetical protein IT328_08480 [Caldilineaceae bacterium]|nr:hypothetical protein [Caldilineaceae bacterium]